MQVICAAFPGGFVNESYKCFKCSKCRVGPFVYPEGNCSSEEAGNEPAASRGCKAYVIWFLAGSIDIPL